MNKKLLLALTSSAFVLMLSACGESSTEEEQVEADKKREEVTEEFEDESSTETEEMNQTIANDDLIKIELLNVERTNDEILGDNIKVNFDIENKTDNKIVVQSRDVSADGYMIDDIVAFSPEIAPNKKIKDSLEIEEMFLEEGDELPKLEENLEMRIVVINDETYDKISSYDVNINFK